jgi:murein DD-endopeptidase MepM/ murein hydrolase activator NlpD
MGTLRLVPLIRRRLPALLRRARSAGLASVAALALLLAIPAPLPYVGGEPVSHTAQREPGADVPDPAVPTPAVASLRSTASPPATGVPPGTAAPLDPGSQPGLDDPDGDVLGVVSGRSDALDFRHAWLATEDKQALEPKHGPAPSGLTGYQWPIPRGRLTQGFGPALGGSFVVDGEPFHTGIDLATFCGDRVVAAHDGIVLAASRRYDLWLGWQGDLTAFTARLDRLGLWGALPIVVVIDDGNGYRSVYGHLGRATVTVGERVRAGQLIGYEGRTGRASGCHLHYELFSPWESDTVRLDPAIAGSRLLPATQIARIDPELVFPRRPGSAG